MKQFETEKCDSTIQFSTISKAKICNKSCRRRSNLAQLTWIFYVNNDITKSERGKSCIVAKLLKDISKYFLLDLDEFRLQITWKTYKRRNVFINSKITQLPSLVILLTYQNFKKNLIRKNFKEFQFWKREN